MNEKNKHMMESANSGSGRNDLAAYNTLRSGLNSISRLINMAGSKINAWMRNRIDDLVLFLLTPFKYEMFEMIGRMSTKPTKTTREMIKKNKSLDRDEKESNIQYHRRTAAFYVRFLAVFCSFFLVYYFAYPELYAYSEVETANVEVYMMWMAKPYVIIPLLIFGYYLVARLLYYNINKWTFKIISKNLNDDNKRERADLEEYLALQGFNLTSIGMFMIFGTVWIYLFDKFMYANIFLPFTDITLPVMIFYGAMTLCSIYRFIVSIKITKAYFKTSLLKAMIPIFLEIAFFAVFIILTGTIMNMVVLQLA